MSRAQALSGDFRWTCEFIPNELCQRDRSASAAQAFYLARTGRPGPVLVDVPKDIQQQLAVPDWDAPMAIAGYMSRLPPPPEDAQVAAVVPGPARGAGSSQHLRTVGHLPLERAPSLCWTAAGHACFHVRRSELAAEPSHAPSPTMLSNDHLCCSAVRNEAAGLHASLHPMLVAFRAWVAQQPGSHSCVVAQAKRPVLYVGGGCLDAAPELRAFVERTGIPVAQTLMGLGKRRN